MFDSGIQGLVLNKLGRKLWGFVEQLWGNVEISKLSVMKLKICEMRATAILHKNENGECSKVLETENEMMAMFVADSGENY